jgi:hypothetical protein
MPLQLQLLSQLLVEPLSDDDDQAEQLAVLGEAGSDARPSSWDSFSVYQHTLSKIVHAEADSETGTFKCGVKCTSEHRFINESAFLENRKCKRCLRVINSAE